MSLLKIAIDGYSSTGKSTFAKLIAAKYGLVYVDTGAIYRTITYAAICRGISLDGEINLSAIETLLKHISISFQKSADNKTMTFLDGENVEEHIRSLEVSSKVSPVSAIPEVRSFVNSLLLEFGRVGGVVMDGRDIGTVVMPDADLKIFMTASDQVRAQRRYEEMLAKGNTSITFEEVLANLSQRDRIDSTRSVAPLRKADDALVLDNSDMTLEQQMVWVSQTLCRNNFIYPKDKSRREY